MKITIDGLNEKMVEGLCRKWRYPEKVPFTEEVEVPDRSPDAEENDTVMEQRTTMVPNEQSEEDFVREYVSEFVKNEYRLVVRQDKKDASEKEADAEVEREVSLT